MKARDQAAMSDGFDKNVAEKMPKIRKQEEDPFRLGRRNPSGQKKNLLNEDPGKRPGEDRRKG